MKEARLRRKASAPPKATTQADPHTRDRPYHHGALPHALLAALELVLRRDGIRDLTLRSIAREAGVSRTAPQHHFGGTASVLSELVASGHRQLGDAMTEKAEGIKPGQARRNAIARGYVSFAAANPDLLHLTSRSEMLDRVRPSLVQARQVSARTLAGAFSAASERAECDESGFGGITSAEAIAMTAA
jgi:AcrR family transcriptional regulator